MLCWIKTFAKRAQDSLMQPPRSLLPSRQILTHTEIIDVEEAVTKPSYMTSPTDSGVTGSGRNTRCSWIEGESSDGGLISENDDHDCNHKKQKKNNNAEAGNNQLDCMQKMDSPIEKEKSVKRTDNIETATLTKSTEHESESTVSGNITQRDNNKIKVILPVMYKFNMSAESKNLIVNKSIICDELVLSNSQSRIDQQFVSTESEVSLDGLDEETIVDKAVSAGLVEPTTDTHSDCPGNSDIEIEKNRMSPDIENYLTPAFDPDDMVNPEYKRTTTRPPQIVTTSTIELDKLVDDTSRNPDDDELSLRFPPIQRTYQNKKLSKIKETNIDCPSPALSPRTISDDVLVLRQPTSSTTIQQPDESQVTLSSTSSQPTATNESVIFSMTPNQKPAPLSGNIVSDTSSKRQTLFGQVVFSTTPSNITSSIIQDWSRTDDDFLIQSDKTDGDASNHSSISNCGSQILCRHSYIKNDQIDSDDRKLIKTTPILTKTAKGFTIQFKKEIPPSSSMTGEFKRNVCYLCFFIIFNFYLFLLLTLMLFN